MLIPDKDPDIIAARECLNEAHRAAADKDYERVAALTALAQTRIGLARHEAAVDTADYLRELGERLDNISGALVSQSPL